MASPFPGMDPYLEQPGVWHDFHERFCPAVAELLTAQVRPNFIVRIDEQVYIHELPAPSEVRLPGVDVERLSFVEVRDRETERVVATAPAEELPKSTSRLSLIEASRVLLITSASGASHGTL